ncbi:MAG TPA: S9 family peptidase [Allosphingosinicella sp.]|nr:S9 family peptidase [Allosphingosinicella sp.]
MIRRQVLGLAAGAALLPHARLSAQAAAAAARPAPRPAEDFAALPFMDGPRLSPDGTKVASRIAVGGKLFFAVSPLFGEAKPRLFQSGDSDINWWRWVNDDWLVLGIGDTVKVEGEDFYVRRAIGVGAADGRMVPLAWRDAAQGADDVIWVADDGRPLIRLARQTSIYLSDEGFWPEVLEIDVSNGKSKSVVRPHPQVVGWYADGSGTVRVGIGATNEGRSLRLLYRERDGAGFDVIDRANTRKGQKLLLPSLFLPEPGQALAVDDREGFDALYKLDLKTMTVGERVFAVPGYDVDGIVADGAKGRLLGIAVTETAAKVNWLDEDLRELQASLDAAVPGRRASIVSMDKLRQRFLIHIGAADRPGTFYYVTALGGALQRLAHVNSRIGAGKLHPVRTLRYKARDGLEIPAVLTLPAGVEAKGLPVVVMPHGGPFARDSEEWDWWSQFLADRGYAVIQPNYRGSSGYGTAFAEKGEGQWGLAMQDDLNDALAHLAKEGIADPKRAAMAGASYGGYAAMRAAQRDGALYRCAISFAGVSDLAALVRYDSRFLNSGRGVDWLRKQAPNLRNVSPINFAEQFSIPILLVHGRRDQRVPVRQSRELAEKLKRAGKSVDYVEQPEGDHHFSRQADRLQFLTALEAFLAKHNPA